VAAYITTFFGTLTFIFFSSHTLLWHHFTSIITMEAPSPLSSSSSSSSTRGGPVCIGIPYYHELSPVRNLFIEMGIELKHTLHIINTRAEKDGFSERDAHMMKATSEAVGHLSTYATEIAKIEAQINFGIRDRAACGVSSMLPRADIGVTYATTTTTTTAASAPVPVPVPAPAPTPVPINRTTTFKFTPTHHQRQPQ
jgi:hypothetical protein